MEEQRKNLVQFGIRELDAELGGLEPGDLCVIAGQTSRGKTSLALSPAMHTAKIGHYTAIFSVEMSVDRIIRRLMSGKSNISVSELKRGLQRQPEIERFERAWKCLRELPIYAEHPSNIVELINRCRALKARSVRPPPAKMIANAFPATGRKLPREATSKIPLRLALP
jgi:replicative DNA helicase